MKRLYKYLEDFATPTNTMGMGNPGVIDGNTLTEPVGKITKEPTAKCKKQKKKRIEESLFDDDLVSKNPLDEYTHPKSIIELEESIRFYIELTKPKTGDTVDLNWIDTSKVKNMAGLFWRRDLVLYNYNISEWNVKNVKDMGDMFHGCKYFNCDLNKWDMSNVKSMFSMFYNCESFNGDISDWNVDGVTNFGNMFTNCTSFNQDLSKWNINEAIIIGMFHNCPKMKEKNKPRNV